MKSVLQLALAALLLAGTIMASSPSFAASGSLSATQAKELIHGFAAKIDKQKGQVILSGLIPRECVSELQVLHDPPDLNNQVVFTVVDPNGRGLQCLTGKKGVCASNASSCSTFEQLAQEPQTLTRYRSIAVVGTAGSGAVKTSLRTYGVSSRPLANGDLPPPDAFDQLEAMAMVECACGVPNPPGVDAVASQVGALQEIVSAAGSTEMLSSGDGQDHSSAEFIDTGETVGEAFGGGPVFSEMPVPVDQVAPEDEDPRARARRRLAERREIEEAASIKAQNQVARAQLIEGGFALATGLLPMIFGRKSSSSSSSNVAGYPSPYMQSPGILGGYNFFNYPVSYNSSNPVMNGGMSGTSSMGSTLPTGPVAPIGATGPMSGVGGWWQNGSAPKSR